MQYYIFEKLPFKNCFPSFERRVNHFWFLSLTKFSEKLHLVLESCELSKSNKHKIHFNHGEIQSKKGVSDFKNHSFLFEIQLSSLIVDFKQIFVYGNLNRSLLKLNIFILLDQKTKKRMGWIFFEMSSENITRMYIMLCEKT